MRSLPAILALCLPLPCLASPPAITQSPATASRSERLLVKGSGFGLGSAGGRIEIDGIPAPFTRWTGSTIAAYIPASIGAGQHQLRVITSEGTATRALTVADPQPSDPHVRWRFMADSDRVESRPVLGPDGTVYLQDRDNLYSLTPAGAVNWVFRAVNSAYYGRLDRAPDGALYAGFGNRVYAINPDGTQRWVFIDTAGPAIFAGPNLGPDGNIYAATADYGSNGQSAGLGLFSLTPAGMLRWNQPGFANRSGFHGEPIVFGSVDQTRLFFAANALGGMQGTFFSYNLGGALQWQRIAGGYPALGPADELYAFTNGGPPPQFSRFDPASGQIIWNHPATLAFNPEAGPDGALYCSVTVNGGIQAIAPDASTRWSRASFPNPASGDDAYIYEPGLNPQNSLLLLSGYTPFTPGFFAALSPATGATLWTVPLPAEGEVIGSPAYIRPSPFNRPRFTPGGDTAYLGTSRSDASGDPYSYLYALNTGTPTATCAPDVDASGALTVQDIFTFLNAWFAGSASADFDHSGALAVNDIFSFLSAWFTGC